MNFTLLLLTLFDDKNYNHKLKSYLCNKFNIPFNPRTAVMGLRNLRYLRQKNSDPVAIAFLSCLSEDPVNTFSIKSNEK
jgi:hypothetical protein